MPRSVTVGIEIMNPMWEDRLKDTELPFKVQRNGVMWMLSTSLDELAQNREKYHTDPIVRRIFDRIIGAVAERVQNLPLDVLNLSFGLVKHPDTVFCKVENVA